MMKTTKKISEDILEEELRRENNIAIKASYLDSAIAHTQGINFKLWTRTLNCLVRYCKSHGLDTTNDDTTEFVKIVAKMPDSDIPKITHAGKKVQEQIRMVRETCKIF